MRIPNIHAVHLDPVELEIINSFLVLMIRTGYKQVTMQHIIQSSDLTKSQMYRRFASKDDLVCRLLLAHEMELSEHLDQWLQLEPFDKVIDSYLQFLLKHPDKFKLIQSLEVLAETEFGEKEQAIQWQRLKARNLLRLDNELTKSKPAISLPGCGFYLIHCLLRGLGQTQRQNYFADPGLTVAQVKQCILKLVSR